MKQRIALFLTVLAVASCTSVTERQTATVSSSNASGAGAVTRYLAWYEGDLQTDYQVNRDLAGSKLAEVESKAPAFEDSDAYLEYLSLTDASGKHEVALKKIREYLMKYPEDRRGQFLLAVHYWRTNKRELTNYLFSQLEKDKTFPWKSLLFNNLGMMALQDKNRLLAIDYLQKAVKETPATAAPFVNLGALYLQSRSYVPAQPLFQRAVDLDADFEDAHVGLGIALEGQGKNEEAKKVYSDFIASHPTAMTVVYNQSVLLGNRLGQKEEAAQLMLRYIQRGGKETAKAQEIIQSWR